ncbi:MAG: tetratricopeptide repeat protein [Azospirillaceae bacterium]|nr:tetratricopeptide repeat protein [Azospirillaceae bacterium]
MTAGQPFFTVPVARPGAPSQRRRSQALISQALAFQARGDMGQMEMLLRQVLALDPAEADALQLLGLAAKARGDLTEAEALMRQSLAVNNRQPHVNFNLGNLLKDTGRPADALPFYERAVTQKPDYAEAHTNRAEALVALAEREETREGRTLRLEGSLPLFRRALRLNPDHVPARVGMAEALSMLGRFAEAETLLRDGLARRPGDVFLTNNLGLILRHQQKFEEAAPHLRAAVRNAPDRWQTWLNLGNTLLALGEMEEAIHCLKQVVVLDPANFFAQDNLNKALWETGQHELLMNSYEWAKQRLPDDPDLLEMTAEAYTLYSRYAEAEANLDAAAALRPDSPAQPRLRTTLRLRQNRAAEAMEIARAGLAASPGDTRLLSQMAESALRADRPADALAAARRLGALQPDNQFAVAYEATALRLLDDPAAGWLYDYDTFVRQVDLAPPRGYTRLDAFHADLLAALEAQHVATHEPIEQTLRHGTQTRENLFTRVGAAPAIQALRDSIMAAARAYVDDLPEDDGHPYLRRRGQKLEWSGSWSAQLRDQGYHTDHIHPEGWISGCYYARLPDVVADADSKQGWITFGAVAMGSGPTRPWERAIQPRPGLLVLFPSYMWHGTIPFHGPQLRTTVAFDLAGRP